jgi:serine/threonine protein kinase
MPVRIEPNAEPIPGYRLIERLGGGGFGEVWKAEAPGGLHKAIKFVYGDLQAADDTDGNRAEQELKALSRVKTVHHPYILSLERYDIISGQLVIVMELADRTLWDRFRECRSQGLPGIPRPELLRYLEETAEALDLMNQQYQLQHLDIKPQNLFLVFNHVKVADFGLVKDLGNMAAATVTGGVTPVYAAPETFDGWLSRFSDQYSLAIVYQELLTGQRPFTGATVRQLVMQHLQGDPDLAMLPLGDRPAISRALSKNPEDRFPSCVEFINALNAVTSPKPAPETPASAPPVLDEVQGQEDALDQAPAKEGLRDTPIPDNETDAEQEEPAKNGRANVLPPRPDKRPVDTPPPDKRITETPPPDYDNDEEVPKSMARTCFNRPRAAGDAPRLDESALGGVVQPALVVGLGKLGVHTLLALRKHLTQEVAAADALPHLRLLAIDTDPDTLHAAGNCDPRVSLRNQEVFLARLHRPSYYLHMRDRDGKLVTDSWLNPKLLYRVPRQTNSATMRPLGRLAFVDNFRQIARRFEHELLEAVNPETLHEVSQKAPGIRSAVPRIYLIAGLGGNTGSGMFLDAAYVMRNTLRKHGYGRAEIVGLLYLPDVPEDANRAAVALTQTYAALAEMHHYSSGQGVFTAHYPIGDNPAGRVISEAGSPFQRCFLLRLPTPKTATIPAESVPETVAMGGQFLYRDLATPLGRALETTRAAARSTGASGPWYQTFGMHRVIWPRRRLLEKVALKLCRRTVDRWMTKDAKAMSERIAHWAQEQWEAHGLRPEALITRHLQDCERKLQKPPDRLLLEALEPLQRAMMQGVAPVPASAPAPVTKGGAPPTQTLNVAPVISAFAALDKLLGVPEECRQNSLTHHEPAVLERLLNQVGEAIGEQCDQRLTELVVRLLEEPAFRLAGAEEALRQFCTVAEQSLSSQEALSKELHERAAALYLRIHALLESPQQQPVTQSNSIWKLGFSRKTPTGKSTLGSDLCELLRVYAKTRFQSLVLAQVNKGYLGLRGHFSDQIREVGFCRQRLGELLALLEERPNKSLPGFASFEKLLLSEGCHKIDDAVERLDGRISADDLVTFDKQVQQLVRQQYRALLNVCMGPANIVRGLAPQLLQEAEKFLGPRLEGASVAELWLGDRSDEQAIRHRLMAGYEQAAPRLNPDPDAPELAVTLLPTGNTGEMLQAQLKQALPSVQGATIERSDEIVFYRERHQLTLANLEQFGPAVQELYRKRCASDPSSVHCREDVPGWQPLAAAQ